jgi:hypothetical protein
MAAPSPGTPPPPPTKPSSSFLYQHTPPVTPITRPQNNSPDRLPGKRHWCSGCCGIDTLAGSSGPGIMSTGRAAASSVMIMSMSLQRCAQHITGQRHWMLVVSGLTPPSYICSVNTRLLIYEQLWLHMSSTTIATPPPPQNPWQVPWAQPQ